MGILEESGGRSLLSGGFDPHGRSLFVARVNGTTQFAGVSIRLEDGAGGSVQVTSDGIVTLDDSGIPAPALGEIRQAGTFTFRIGNGIAESQELLARIEVVGRAKAATPYPQSAFVAVEGVDVVLDEANRVEQWVDQTGNGNHFYQDVEAKRPVQSIDENGSMRIYQNGQSHEHLRMPEAVVPKDASFHAVFAFKEETPQRGLLFSQHFPVQRMGVWWEGLATASEIQSGSAGFLEIHTGDAVFSPTGNQGAFGEAHRGSNVVLARDIFLDTSTGYNWTDVRLFASRDATDSALDAAYNLTGSIYAVAFFSDWEDAEQAIAWASERIATNAAPVANDTTMNFNAGANQ